MPTIKRTKPISSAAQAIGQHVDDSVEMAELAIAAMEAEIKEEGDREGSIAELRNVMRQQQQWAETPEVFFMSQGWRASSFPPSPPGPLLSTSQTGTISFTTRIPCHLALYRSPTSQSRDGNWAITVSRRLNGSDGSFQGI